MHSALYKIIESNVRCLTSLRTSYGSGLYLVAINPRYAKMCTVAINACSKHYSSSSWLHYTNSWLVNACVIFSACELVNLQDEPRRKSGNEVKMAHLVANPAVEKRVGSLPWTYSLILLLLLLLMWFAFFCSFLSSIFLEKSDFSGVKDEIITVFLWPLCTTVSSSSFSSCCYVSSVIDFLVSSIFSFFFFHYSGYPLLKLSFVLTFYVCKFIILLLLLFTLWSVKMTTDDGVVVLLSVFMLSLFCCCCCYSNEDGACNETTLLFSSCAGRAMKKGK